MAGAQSSAFVEGNEDARPSERAIGDPANGRAVPSGMASPILQAPEGDREGLDGSDSFAAYFTSIYDLVRALVQAMPYIAATPDIVDFLSPRLAARLKVSVGHDRFAAAEELVAVLSAHGRGDLKRAVLRFVENVAELHYCLRTRPTSTERPAGIPAILDIGAYRSMARFLKDELDPVKEYLATQAVEGCLGDTRTQVLNDLKARVVTAIGRGGLHLIWLKGIVGAGKTSIMSTLSRWLHDVERVAAVRTFFCSRDDVGRSNPHRILATLAYKLGISTPGVGQAIEQALSAQETPTAPADQLRRLILNPLQTIGGGSTVLLIDALDECKGGDGLQQLLRALSGPVDDAARLVFVVSSRPDRPIVDHLPSPFATIDLGNECYAPQARDDVRTYLHHNLRPDALVPYLGNLPNPMSYERAMSMLIELTAGYFVVAAFTCSVIKHGVNPEAFLRATLSRTGFHNQTSMLYGQFSFAIRAALGGDEWMEWRSDIGRVLGVLCCAQQPLTIENVAALADADVATRLVSKILESLAPLLACRDKRYTFFHASVSDFLQQISDPSILFAKVEAPAVHGDLATRCLGIMARELRFNICGLENAGTSWNEVAIESIPSPLRYSSLFWTHHYMESSLSNSEPVVSFLKGYFLFWVEILCVSGKLRANGIGGLNQVISKLGGPTDKYISDCRRCLDLWSDEISESPGHLYLGVLPWLPQRFRSVVRASVPRLDSVLPRLTLGGKEDWPTSLSKWTMPGAVGAVSFSPKGSVIAVAFDHTIEVRSMKTGETRRIFEGHTGRVLSVAFSPDGSIVASGSDDKTVRLWDVQTGEAHHVFQGHADCVRSVTFSPDGSTVTSGSDDGTVRLWDVQTGEAHHVFQGHTDWVQSVAFGPDGSTVASGSDDRTVRLWDVQTGKARHAFQGHTDHVLSVALSPDGSTVASGSSDTTVRLWDVRTGEAGHVFDGHTNYVSSVAFSPDGSIVASGSNDKTVRLWDTQTGEADHIFKGHIGWVLSVAFSSDGSTVAFGSDDKTVRLWDAQTGEALHVFEGHTSWVQSVVFSPDGSTVTSGSSDETVRLWDVQTGEAGYIFDGHTSAVSSVAFSPDGSTVASSSSDATVRLWDVRTGEAGHVFEGHTDYVSSAAFSPDGSTVASGSDDKTVRLWDMRTGEARRIFEGHMDWVRSVAFSHNMQTLISTSSHEVLRWDLKTIEPRHTHPRAYENENPTASLTASEPSPVSQLFLPHGHHLMDYSSASHTAVGCFGNDLWILELPSDDPWKSLCEAHEHWEKGEKGGSETRNAGEGKGRKRHSSLTSRLPVMASKRARGMEVGPVFFGKYGPVDCCHIHPSIHE